MSRKKKLTVAVIPATTEGARGKVERGQRCLMQ